MIRLTHTIGLRLENSKKEPNVNTQSVLDQEEFKILMVNQEGVEQEVSGAEPKVSKRAKLHFQSSLGNSVGAASISHTELQAQSRPAGFFPLAENSRNNELGNFAQRPTERGNGDGLTNAGDVIIKFVIGENHLDRLQPMPPPTRFMRK